MEGWTTFFLNFQWSVVHSGRYSSRLTILSQVWETPYSVTDSSFPCKVDRTAGPLPDADHMYMINHSLNTKLFGSNSLIVPDYSKAKTTNSVAS